MARTDSKVCTEVEYVVRKEYEWHRVHRKEGGVLGHPVMSSTNEGTAKTVARELNLALQNGARIGAAKVADMLDRFVAGTGGGPEMKIWRDGWMSAAKKARGHLL